MRKHQMSDSEAVRFIRPSKASDRRTLFKLAAFLLLVFICLAGLLYNKHWQQMKRERDWASTVATIEETRTQLIMQRNSVGGGAMLSEVQIRAKFAVDGLGQERGIT